MLPKVSQSLQTFFLSKFAEMRLLITLYTFSEAASIFDKDVCLKCLSKCTYTTN